MANKIEQVYNKIVSGRHILYTHKKIATRKVVNLHLINAKNMFNICTRYCNIVSI